MVYQVTLTPEEYAALLAAATEQGKTIEVLVHETLAERFHAPLPPAPQRPMTEREFLEELYRGGIISNIPTGELDTPEEAAERERLISSIAPGEPLSEIVIEDRGPR